MNDQFDNERADRAVRDFWQNRDAWDDDRPQDTRTGRYLEDLPDEEDDQTFKDPGRPSDRRNQTPATDEAIDRATRSRVDHFLDDLGALGMIEE